jgi:SAM-dependent methyltransferase
VHAERYAANTVHHAGPSLAVLRDFAELCADDMAVDVATGTGSTAFALARHVAQVIGIDVAFEMIEQGPARAAREEISKVRCLDGSAEQIPLADGASTLVTSMHASHHFHACRIFSLRCVAYSRPRDGLCSPTKSHRTPQCTTGWTAGSVGTIHPMSGNGRWKNGTLTRRQPGTWHPAKRLYCIVLSLSGRRELQDVQQILSLHCVRMRAGEQGSSARNGIGV